MNISTHALHADIPRQRWLRIIPPILIACIISYMDRVNIAFAMPGGMDEELGITATMAGLAGGIFFIGYLFLQVPGGKIAVHGSGKKFIGWSLVAWAVISGLIELIAGLRARKTGDPFARDAILIGAVTLALAVALLLVNPAYSLEYAIKEAGATFTLTGITIGVGLFGGYAAIVAVFLGIAGFSPRRTSLTPADTGVNASTTPTAEPGDAPARPAGETA